MIFEKSSKIKFHENPASGSQDITYGRTDITKVLVAFRNSAKAPEEETIHKTLQKFHTASVLQGKKKWPNFTYYKCFETHDPL